MSVKSQAVSGILRTKYQNCGQIKGSPSRVFDWKLRKEEPPSPGKQTCVFVFHNATGEKIPVYTSLAHTLQFVKQQISASVTIPPQMMKLSFQGQILADDCTLVSYGIAHGNCLHLTCAKGADSAGDAASHRRLMGITVCCIDDSPRPILARLRICARPSDKVLEVKLQLEAQTGVPAGSMRITLGGRTLANEQTLIECGVDESKVLQLVFPFGPADVLSSASLKRNDHFAAPGSAAVERLCFPVTVKEVWPTGKRRHVGLTTDSTIRSLKEQLANWSGITPDKQILLHRGRMLQDDLTASYYNLEGGASLDLAIVGGVKPVLKEENIQRPQEKRRSGGPRRTVYFAASSDKSEKADYKGPLDTTRKSRVNARSLTKQLVHDEMEAIMQQAGDAEEHPEEDKAGQLPPEQPEPSASVKSEKEKDDEASRKAAKAAADAKATADAAKWKAEVAAMRSQQRPDDEAPAVSQTEENQEPAQEGNQDSPSNDVPRLTLIAAEGDEQHGEVQLSTSDEQALLLERAKQKMLGEEPAEDDDEEDEEKQKASDRASLAVPSCQLPHNWHKQGTGHLEMQEQLGPGEFSHPDYDSDEEQKRIDFTAQSEKPKMHLNASGRYSMENAQPEEQGVNNDVEPVKSSSLVQDQGDSKAVEPVTSSSWIQEQREAKIVEPVTSSFSTQEQEENKNVEPVVSSSLNQEHGENKDVEPSASSSAVQEQRENKNVEPVTPSSVIQQLAESKDVEPVVSSSLNHDQGEHEDVEPSASSSAVQTQGENKDVEPVTSSSVIQQQEESQVAEPVMSSSLIHEQGENKDVGPATAQPAASGDGKALSDEVENSKLDIGESQIAEAPTTSLDAEKKEQEQPEAEAAEAEAGIVAPADLEPEPA